MSEAGPWTLSLDTIFELLSRRRRRYALYVLRRNAGEGMELEELAARVRSLDDGVDGWIQEAVEEGIRDEDVPRLLEVHAIDFDERTGTIRYRGQPSLDEWIEHAEFKEGKRPEE